MAKFHIKLTFEKFALEVDGTRDELPVLREALTQQFAGMLQPATELAAGEVVEAARPVAPPVVLPVAKARKKTSRPAPAASSNGNHAEAAIDWRHDTSKYGSPQQGWTTSQKAIWVLHVASLEANVGEMSGKTIALTFNKHFKQAGLVRPNNVIRDLGKLKAGANGELPLVSQDTTKSPSTWFLTDTGTKSAQKLVMQALGQQAA